MPIAKFEMPDGRIAKFEVPEGTTPEQAQAAVSAFIVKQENLSPKPKPKAEAAPTANMKRGRGIAGQITQDRLAAAASRLKESDPEFAEYLASLSGPEKLAIGMGRGLTDIARGVGLVDDADSLEDEAFKDLTDQSVAADAGRVVGQALPFLPAGLGAGTIASTPARIGAQSLVGASEGAAIASGTGGNVVEGALIGATLGGGSEVALPLLNRGARSLKRALGIKAKTPKGQVTKEFIEELDANGVSYDDFIAATDEIGAGNPADNVKREAIFEKFGLDPTEAQRTRDIDLFVTQQDQYRRTGKVRDALDNQEFAISEKIAEAVTNTGGRPRTGDQSIIAAVTDRSLKLDDEISELYKAARSAANDESVVSLKRGIESLRKNSPLNTLSNGTAQALRDQMQVMGIAGKKGFKSVGRINVNQAEELRQFANSLFDGANPQGRKIIRDFKQALDDDVFSAAGGDVFKQARSAKARFEKGLSKEAKNKFDKNGTSLVRDVLENKIAEEELFEKAIRAKSKYKNADLKDLKRYLLEGDPDDVAVGLQAWNDLRAETMNYIKETAFSGPVNSDGVKTITRNRLQKAFSTIGNDKMKTLFSNKELEFFHDLAALTSLREPPSGTFTGSGPSSPAVQKLEKAIYRIWGVGDVVEIGADSLKNKMAEKRVLKLVNDADLIEKRLQKEAFERLRKSQLGMAASGAAVALPAAALSTKEE